jgi:hypothetical protein
MYVFPRLLSAFLTLPVSSPKILVLFIAFHAKGHHPLRSFRCCTRSRAHQVQRVPVCVASGVLLMCFAAIVTILL